VHILEQACDALKTAGGIQLAVVAVGPAVMKALTVSTLVTTLPPPLPLPLPLPLTLTLTTTLTLNPDPGP